VDEIAERVHARVTVIADDGSVIAESDARPAEMENHASRPELIEAFRQGLGYSTRYSNTVGQDLRYCAIKIDGGAARIAVPLETIEGRVSEIRRQILQ